METFKYYDILVWMSIGTMSTCKGWSHRCKIINFWLASQFLIGYMMFSTFVLIGFFSHKVYVCFIVECSAGLPKIDAYLRLSASSVAFSWCSDKCELQCKKLLCFTSYWVCFCATAYPKTSEEALKTSEHIFLKISEILIFHQKFTISRSRSSSMGPAFACRHGAHTHPDQSKIIFECFCSCTFTNRCAKQT